VDVARDAGASRVARASPVVAVVVVVGASTRSNSGGRCRSSASAAPTSSRCRRMSTRQNVAKVRARRSVRASVGARVEDSRCETVGLSSIRNNYSLHASVVSSNCIAASRRVELSRASSYIQRRPMSVDASCARIRARVRRLVGGLSVHDLRRRRLHDDNLRLSRDTNAGADVRHGRRRRLSIVHLPTHLALQAAAEARARQARKRRVDAHAVQRFSIHARVVAHREREDRLQQHRDAARQEAITRSRTLGDRPEVTRETKVPVHAVPAIVKTPKERVIHSHRLHDDARAVGRTVRLVRVRHVDRSSARRRRARCDARAVDDSFIPQVASEAGSSAARRLDFDESRPTDEPPPTRAWVLIRPRVFVLVSGRRWIERMSSPFRRSSAHARARALATHRVDERARPFSSHPIASTTPRATGRSNARARIRRIATRVADRWNSRARGVETRARGVGEATLCARAFSFVGSSSSRARLEVERAPVVDDSIRFDREGFGSPTARERRGLFDAPHTTLLYS